MFKKLWWAFARIFWQDQIPKLPRGMLASRYEDVNCPERRAMARLGTRDIVGVRRAMRLHGVSSVDELIRLLEHHQPKRNIRHRILNGLGRVVGGSEQPPHQEEIKRAFRQKKNNAEINERIKQVRRMMHGKG